MPVRVTVPDRGPLPAVLRQVMEPLTAAMDRVMPRFMEIEPWIIWWEAVPVDRLLRKVRALAEELCG